MDFYEAIQLRKSIRKYTSRKIEPKVLDRIFNATRLAPSGCNAQPWKFIVVDDPELKNALANATQDRLIPVNHFTKQAPVHVVVVREKANLTSNLGQVIKNKNFPLIDIGIAVEHFCLKALEEGLGTCILGWFNEKKVKKLLGIPLTKRAELIITVGYPASDVIREKRRKPFNEICAYNRYA